MRRALTLEIDPSEQPGREILAPRPFDHWGQRLREIEIDGAACVSEIAARNSDCRAYRITPNGRMLRLRYLFDVADAADPAFAAPDWVWRVDKNRHTTAGPSLIEAAYKLATGALDQRETLRRLVLDAADLFHYGHPDSRFTDGCDCVPAVCGLTRGSCVDINTYLLAAALALGIRGQYVAGYWFHPDHRTTPDMHCWLAFEPELADGGRRLVFWDLAHAIKWADSLGAQIEEGLNPAGGRRLAMSCGRGLSFETAQGPVSISHFSEPVAIGEDGVQERPVFRASLEEA